MKKDLSDPELLDLFSKDEEAGMEWMFRQYYRYVSQAVFRLVPDAQVADDIAQEVFLEVWKRRESFSINTSLKAYLRRSAVNRTLNYLRDNRNRFNEELSEAQNEIQVLPTASLETNELEKQIHQSIAQLPERCRIAFQLSRQEEMTYQEIADHMGVSVKTVENQIVKALRLLRQSLKPFLETGLLIAWLWTWFP